MSETSPKLASLERWFQEVATHADGVEAGAATAAALADEPGGIEATVEPSAELTAAERVRIYSNMYLWRLVDILVEEYPTTRHAVGPESFWELARAYVQAHPSTSFTLNALGARFPAFLRNEAAEVPNREVVWEVARLERTMEEVFAARHQEPLSVEALAEVAPEAWPETRFEVIPALRLLETRHPVNEYVRAVRAEEAPELPEPDSRCTVVWRRNWKVWRTDLSAAQRAILSGLVEGRTLGAALAAAAELPGVTDGELADVGAWFQDWTREGMFAGTAPY